MEHTKEPFTPNKAFDIVVESNRALTKKNDKLKEINADLLEMLKKVQETIENNCGWSATGLFQEDIESLINMPKTRKEG